MTRSSCACLFASTLLFGCSPARVPTPKQSNSLSVHIRAKAHEAIVALPGTKLVLSPFGGDRADGTDYELENVSQVGFMIAWTDERWEVNADLANNRDVELSIHTKLREFSSDIGWEGTGSDGGKLTIHKYRPRATEPFETVVQANRKTVITPLNPPPGVK